MPEREPTTPPPAKGLASRQNPGRWVRHVQSFAMRRMLSASARDARRRRAEKRRQRSGQPHRIEYFHQVDDPYSHLAVQALLRLRQAYDAEWIPHLTARESGANAPEPELLAAYARRDAADVAPHYGVAFPRDASAPPPERVRLAERVVAAADPRDFAERAVLVGRALWGDDKDELTRLAHDLPLADEATAARAAESGARRRSELGHYSGATFHYAGEWYWGVDRLCHLEARLLDLGAGREGAGLVAPRPDIDAGDCRDASAITLEVYPSLRSPYTAVIFDRSLELARRTGVRLVLRPVMPMVMRGVPATLTKGRYIFSDAMREAELLGVPFGRMLDPIGKPVMDGFSLFPWARDQGRGAELLSSFLRCAFTEAVDTSTPAGMRRVVEEAGLSWEDALPLLGNGDWRDEVESNRLSMYEELGLWGVPSYRVMGPAGEPDWSAWGQDRLWRVAQEIRRRAAL